MVLTTDCILHEVGSKRCQVSGHFCIVHPSPDWAALKAIVSETPKWLIV